MKEKEVPVDLFFKISFLRSKKTIFVKLFEIFDKNFFFSAIAYEKKIKIRFWDNEKTIKKKIKFAKYLLLLKYFKEKKKNEKIFEICQKESSNKLIPAGLINVSNLEKNKESDQKTLIEKENNILNLNDFLDKRK